MRFLLLMNWNLLNPYVWIIKNTKELSKLVEFKHKEDDADTNRLNCDFKLENTFSNYSIVNYLKRIAHKIINKLAVGNVILNLLAKKEIEFKFPIIPSLNLVI